MTRAIVALVFCCTVTGVDLVLNDEVAAVQWATQAEVADVTAKPTPYASSTRSATTSDPRHASTTAPMCSTPRPGRRIDNFARASAQRGPDLLDRGKWRELGRRPLIG
jgi:hypothetical protein